MACFETGLGLIIVVAVGRRQQEKSEEEAGAVSDVIVMSREDERGEKSPRSTVCASVIGRR